MKFMELIRVKANQALVGAQHMRHLLFDCYIWLSIDYFLALICDMHATISYLSTNLASMIAHY